MKQLLIKNILHEGSETDILIEGNRFKEIASSIHCPDATIINGKGKAILPPFYNAHTHAAMTLLRGYADDMSLFKWLNEYIWPYEAQMTPEDIYAGSRLAILEMIKSGTIFFNDMYWNVHETIRAAEEMGVRAAIGITFIDHLGEEAIEKNFQFIQNWKAPSSRIHLTVAPHAIYTVGEKLLRRCKEEADRQQLPLHIHLSETKEEVDNCQKEHGVSPVEWLDKIGVLSSNTIAAHTIHLNTTDIQLLKKQQVTCVHNPCSNMKLASGIFPTTELIKAGCRIALGTDGCSSNNNLDMREEMKFAALLAKCHHTAETLPVKEVFQWGTINAAHAFHIEGGLIAEGKLADALLIDLSNERLVPNHHLLSNWIYAANSQCIDTVICDGKILMQDRYVKDEENIIEEARKASQKRS